MTYCPRRPLHIGVRRQRENRITSREDKDVRPRWVVRHPLPCPSAVKQYSGFFKFGQLVGRSTHGGLRRRSCVDRTDRLAVEYISITHRVSPSTRQSTRVIPAVVPSFPARMLRRFRRNLRNKECNLWVRLLLNLALLMINWVFSNVKGTPSSPATDSTSAELDAVMGNRRETRENCDVWLPVCRHRAPLYRYVNAANGSVQCRACREGIWRWRERGLWRKHLRPAPMTAKCPIDLEC